MSSKSATSPSSTSTRPFPTMVGATSRIDGRRTVRPGPDRPGRDPGRARHAQPRSQDPKAFTDALTAAFRLLPVRGARRVASSCLAATRSRPTSAPSPAARPRSTGARRWPAPRSCGSSTASRRCASTATCRTWMPTARSSATPCRTWSTSSAPPAARGSTMVDSYLTGLARHEPRPRPRHDRRPARRTAGPLRPHRRQRQHHRGGGPAYGVLDARRHGPRPQGVVGLASATTSPAARAPASSAPS